MRHTPVSFCEKREINAGGGEGGGGRHRRRVPPAPTAPIFSWKKIVHKQKNAT